jgi:hypothetical protein
MRFIKLHATSIAVMAITACTALAQGHPSCSTSTLHGDYAFQITGQILAPAPVAGPVAGVALTHFDGNGNMTQVDHVVHAGVPPAEEWRPGDGPYFVNPDCTGYMILTPKPTDPADEGPSLRVEFVIGNDGKEIRDVVSSSPSSPKFAAAIISTATKVYQPEDRRGW